MASVKSLVWIFLGCLAYLLPQEVKCRDIFTAYTHMAQLASVELELHKALHDYIKTEEDKLDELRAFEQRVSRERKLQESSEGIKDYAANPIRAYLMLKRFVKQWKMMKVTMPGRQDIILGYLNHYKNLLPSTVDLEGARNAIVRIQETYHLPPSYITAGLRENPTDSLQLSVGDTYTIGRTAYINKKFYTTKIWMEEALRQMNGSTTKGKVKLTDILDHLSWVELQLGNFPQAINYTVNWLSLDPTNARARANLIHMTKENERHMGENKDKIKEPEAKKKKLKPSERIKYSFRNFDWPTERENYKRLCRGAKMLTYEEKQNTSKLKCSYFTKHPLLKLKPARMEQVFEKPPIYVFREFASPQEVEDLKHISSPQLSRATVHNPTTGIIEFANYRISEFSWLYDSDGHTVAKVNARLEAVTQLTVATAEGLQVQNYGMAGQYDPHFDFSRINLEKARAIKEHEKELIKELGDGNRIATALLYASILCKYISSTTDLRILMSEVEAGGATVFPYVGARLTPSEGDLVFWHNLMKSGDGDFRTRHGGCPIISGTKWVANKWFHEVGNEFRRPCGLSPDE